MLGVAPENIRGLIYGIDPGSHRHLWPSFLGADPWSRLHCNQWVKPALDLGSVSATSVVECVVNHLERSTVASALLVHLFGLIG